jgi:hypothetical protein
MPSCCARPSASSTCSARSPGYNPRVSRLDDVIARHHARKKLTSRKAAVIAVGTVVVLTIVLELFTDLGTPNAPPPTPVPVETQHATRVDDVKLVRVPAARAK